MKNYVVNKCMNRRCMRAILLPARLPNVIADVCGTPMLWDMNVYYRPQRSWAKVIFSQACEKNSVQGGGVVCLSACWQTAPRSRHPPGADTPPRSRHPPGADPPRSRHPPGSRLQHTVNERPVRILLECILVNI